MKAFLVVLALIASGCATTQSALQTAYEGAKAASNINESLLLPRCEAIAQTCKMSGDKECVRWGECFAIFKAANKVIKSVHIAVSTGVSLLALGEDKKAQTFLLKATTDLKKAYDMLKEYGVI